MGNPINPIHVRSCTLARCTRKRELVRERMRESACPVRWRDVGNGGHGGNLSTVPNERVGKDMFYLTPPRHISTLNFSE